jgi:hypothetical protein
MEKTMSFKNGNRHHIPTFGKQCPPVEDEDIEDYFNHPAVKYICNYNKNVLDVRKRYDEQLYNILKHVDDIKIGYVKEPSTQRNICFLNRTRIIINKYWNDKIKKEGDLFIYLFLKVTMTNKPKICIHTRVCL